MKILLLCRALTLGGTEGQIVALAKGLQRQGHSVSVAVFFSIGRLESELESSGIQIVDFKKSGRWDIFLFLIRVVSSVKKLRPHLIYGFLSTPNILIIFLKCFFPKIKMVWGVRASNVDFRHYHWLVGLVYRVECLLSRFADLIICNSRAGFEYAAKHGFPGDRMTIISNGIDVSRFNANPVVRGPIRSEWGIEDNAILIGLIARLDPIKDHVTFLRAASMLAKKRSDTFFVCVGSGPACYVSELRQLASDLGLDGRLIWAGERLDVPEVYCALDFATSTSSSEGFSNAIAEAMACGVPCVVTDVGDSALIVGATGIVVSPNSSLALYEGLNKMIGMLGPEIRCAARDSIVSRFTIDLLIANTNKALINLKSEFGRIS